MGGADERLAPRELLRERAPGRDGGGLARFVRRVLRHQRRPGLRVGRRRGQLERDSEGPAGSPFGGGTDTGLIRVELPANLRTLAGVGRVVELNVDDPVTQRSVLDALEAEFPALRGTVREARTKKRRPMLRFYACEEDLSDESPDAALPDEVKSGKEPYLIVGA